MKKIFTLLFAAMALFTAKAQVNVTFNGQTVNSGDVLEIQGNVLDLGGGLSILDWTMEPTFTNAGSSATNLSVTVTKDYTEGPELYWCGITGACANIPGKTETRSTTLQPGGMAMLTLHPEAEPTESVDCTANVQVMAGLNVFSFKIHYLYKGTAGIDGLTAETAGAKAVEGGIALPAGQWAVYTVDGRLVAKGTAATTKQLPRGIYVVKCGKQSQKLLVD